MGMNKKEVIAKVAEMTGEAEETCAKVIKALEKVMQDSLSDFGPISEAFGKIGDSVSKFFRPDSDKQV